MLGRILFLLLFLIPAALMADYNVLIVGSTKSFSDTKEKGVELEPAFLPGPIAASLQTMLSQDTRLKGKVSVVVEDVFRQKDLPTAVGQRAPKPWGMNFHAYSLAQYYFWPDGREARLKNLRGEGGTKWDAVVIMGDPYLIANMPGVYAEGANLIQDEVRAGGAKPVLLMQWPKDPANIDHFIEVISRVGNRTGTAVAPAALAWQAVQNKQTAKSHELAAASVYSVLAKRAAGKGTLAKLAWAAAQNGVKTFNQPFAVSTPFAMKQVHGRQISMHQTGSSSERGITSGLKRVLPYAKVSLGPKPKGGKYDFNLGRGNSNFEKNKQYKVNPQAYGRSYGFPMGERRDLDNKKRDGKGASVSTLYGIDKRYMGGRSYDDGTDLGIAYDMIRQGEVPKDVRCIPIRLLYNKMHAIDPGITPNRDGWHMSGYTDDAAAVFLYVALSGRCPVGDEPKKNTKDPKSISNWRHWLGRKIGYETAWRMSHLHGRVPGFEVLPSEIKATALTPSKPEKVSVRFLYPPKAPVTVAVAVDKRGLATLSMQQLTFTPANYNTTQTITISAAKAGSVKVLFKTTSKDPVYNNLADSWAYKIEK